MLLSFIHETFHRPLPLPRRGCNAAWAAMAAPLWLCAGAEMSFLNSFSTAVLRRKNMSDPQHFLGGSRIVMTARFKIEMKTNQARTKRNAFP